MLVFFFFCFFFSELTFLAKKNFQEYTIRGQPVWIQIRPDNLLGQISVQTVLQMTKVCSISA